MFAGAIFDMDGVLVDNMGVHIEAFAAIARRYGVAFDPGALIAMAGKGNGEIFGELFPAELIERVGKTELADQKEALYREIYAPRLAPVPGLVPFLEDLLSHGVRIALGTSGCTANMDFVLDGLGIRRYFDVLINADKVTRTKPDPEIYLRALSELGLDASDCLVFEDAAAGVAAARAAGIKVVALSTSVDRSVLERTPGVALTIGDFTQTGFASLRSLL